MKRYLSDCTAAVPLQISNPPETATIADPMFHVKARASTRNHSLKMGATRNSHTIFQNVCFETFQDSSLSKEPCNLHSASQFVLRTSDANVWSNLHDFHRDRRHREMQKHWSRIHPSWQRRRKHDRNKDVHNILNESLYDEILRNRPTQFVCGRNHNTRLPIRRQLSIATAWSAVPPSPSSPPSSSTPQWKMSSVTSPLRIVPPLCSGVPSTRFDAIFVPRRRAWRNLLQQILSNTYDRT